MAKRPHALEDNIAAAGFTVAPPVGVDGIDQHIEPPVAVPVDDGDLSPATLAGGPGVQLDRPVVLIHEDAARRQKLKFSTGAPTLEQCEIALVIKHDQIDKPVAGEIHRHRRRAPLGD